MEALTIQGTSRPPQPVPEQGWVELRDTYGSLLCRYHPESDLLEFKVRRNRLVYVYIGGESV